MPQGIIRIDALDEFKDYFDLTVDLALIDLGKLKEALLLPPRYTVEKVERALYNGYKDCAAITVSSPDILQGYPLPNVTPCYLNENSEDGKTKTISLHDILIDGISVIREEDKERKATIEIKEVIEHKASRDTQFSGFAKLLMDELLIHFGDFEDMERIIARRAYGLVEHALKHAPVTEYEARVEDVPDFTEWPRSKGNDQH